MDRFSLSYLVSILILSIGLAIFDIFNFEYILLPLFLIAQIIGLILCACVNRYRGMVKMGFLSIGISLSILVLGGAIGGMLNGQNRADGEQIVSTLETFKLSQGRYPEELSKIPSLALKVSTKRLRFRARYAYLALDDGSAYFLEIQNFPIGFIKWNRITHNWDDEML